jgi:ubiquinol-cytochrome c reductase cytochrome c1 subunit
MMRYILGILLLSSTLTLWAEELPIAGLQLAKAPINKDDLASIKRGAKFFASTCMSCHTLVYLRYDKLANDAGITLDKMPINIKTWPLGITPPDLSLEADVRGVDWIYTYLHSFYKDPSRPTGVNNLLRPNTAMSNMLRPYQGEQSLVANPMKDLMGHSEWYDLVTLDKEGSMSPEEFDATVADLVNFLAYAAAPYREEQTNMGYGVLGFLALFFIFAYLLKKEYWKDVKKHKGK